MVAKPTPKIIKQSLGCGRCGGTEGAFTQKNGATLCNSCHDEWLAWQGFVIVGQWALSYVAWATRKLAWYEAAITEIHGRVTEIPKALEEMRDMDDTLFDKLQNLEGELRDRNNRLVGLLRRAYVHVEYREPVLAEQIRTEIG